MKYANRPKRATNTAAATPIPAAAPELNFEDEGEDAGVDVDVGVEICIEDVPEDEEIDADEDEALDEDAENVVKVEYGLDVGEAITDRDEGFGALKT
ncbi:hypothetical protein EYC80_009583 [Monilinia laxa]|uniref:Uncharacterized protein n=1 Tax=Monilinia laxa TaxID=61186 RepID=A0A5N6JYC1_MONLA|nr:hypothetical protein EYC80_009583 [Monilinia laxa]